MRNAPYEASAYIAGILRSIGHPSRVKILRLIGTESRCVYELCASLGLEQSNVSQHLRALRSSGVLRAKREGNRVYYSACCADVERILHAAEAIANHCTLSEMDALAGRSTGS